MFFRKTGIIKILFQGKKFKLSKSLLRKEIQNFLCEKHFLFCSSFFFNTSASIEVFPMVKDSKCKT